MKKFSTLLVFLTASVLGVLQEPGGKEQSEPEWVTHTKLSLAMTLVPPSQFEEDWSILPVQSIRLSRSGPGGKAEGFYPEYEISLSVATKESKKALGTNQLGPIKYNGIKDVEMIGERGSALTYGDFARLCLLAEEIGLLEGMKSYPKRSDIDPHTTLEFVMKSGETVKMSEWGWQAPAGVWALCCSIDKIWADR